MEYYQLLQQIARQNAAPPAASADDAAATEPGLAVADPHVNGHLSALNDQAQPV